MKIYFNDIFAVTLPGLESVCAEEIRVLLGCDVDITKGGVSFSGGLRELYLANLWLRTASRLLVRVGEVRSTDFPELHQKVKKLPWGRFIRPDRSIVVKSSSSHSRLNHTDRISETIKDAVNRSLGREMPADEDSPQVVMARLENDQCLLSVDSSGDLLHRRGYRVETSRAPLRETLAAGILKLLGWNGQVPLYDPMCGSGTFLIEGALIASRRPPGQSRGFACQQWPRYREGLWNNLHGEGRRTAVDVKVPIIGSDFDSDVVAIAGRNAERALCHNDVRLEAASLREVTPPAEAGLVVCNPPYGVRLGKETELLDLYRQIGETFQEKFSGWRAALFCPNEDLVAATGLNFKVEAELMNGGLPTKLYVCEL